jgi:hypothetical protein
MRAIQVIQAEIPPLERRILLLTLSLSKGEWGGDHPIVMARRSVGHPGESVFVRFK